MTTLTLPTTYVVVILYRCFADRHVQLLAMKRVGVLSGGHPHILDIARTVPPSQRLKVARYEELKKDVDYGSTTAVEDEDEDDEDIVVKRKLKLRN